MAHDTSENNKRIAKNTILLYIRMLFLMIISLYTSRVILKALGVEDYGIYNVVGGIVIMSSFFRNTLSGATQRFLAICLGKNDTIELHATFRTTMFLHVAICVITIILAESIGLWFLNEKLVIPEERLYAANFVYQFSVYTFVFATLSAPYTAVIIAREKMGVFAYFSLIEAIVNLIIAYVINNGEFDRLVLYGLLMFFNSLLLQIIYVIYCRKHFDETRFNIKYESAILRKMTSFMGWSFYANIAGVFYGQGINILLNMFFGPAVNAARGLAYQIQSAVLHFTTNFQMAVNPQIYKYYASGRINDMYTLMKRSSRFSFYVLLIICMPVILSADIIFKLWLVEVPQNAVLFCQLVLIISLIDTVSSPLTTATKATGKLKKNALLGGTNLLMIIPISYFFLVLGYPPAVVFYVNIMIALIGMMIRLYINKHLINFPVKDFLRDVFARGWLIAIIAGALPYTLYVLMPRNIITLIVVTICSVITNVIVIYLIGITREEKYFLTNKVKQILLKNDKSTDYSM